MLRPSGVLEDVFLIMDLFTCVLVGLECTYCVCVSSIRGLDCVGFCPFELWRCVFFEMMWGIGGEGFVFSFLGYRRVSPEYRRKHVTCLVLLLLLL
jgi:hypothetical protein